MTDQDTQCNYIKLLIAENSLDQTCELELVKLIFDKYGLMRLKDYAASIGQTEQGVLKRKAKDRQAFVTLGNTDFYF